VPRRQLGGHHADGQDQGARPDRARRQGGPAWLGKFLKKEAADKKGKKHIKPFTGSAEDLTTLVDWLQKQTK
jgi:hypothetical protein